jgi:hypothetical protein
LRLTKKSKVRRMLPSKDLENRIYLTSNKILF